MDWADYLESKLSFWAYIRFNMIYKFIGILDLLSHGNFYFNTAIFSSILFFAHIAFYRIYSEIYPGQKIKKPIDLFLPAFACIVCWPCIQKDGLVFLGLALVSYIFYRLVSGTGRLSLKYILFFLLGTLVIFMVRNYVIVAMMPAMAIALLCKILPYPKRYIVLIAYAVFVGLFFLSAFSNLISKSACGSHSAKS